MMGLINPWALVGIAIALAGAFMGGIKVESDHRDAQLLVQEQAYHKAYIKRAGELRGNADAVSEKLNQAEADRKRDRQTFNRKLREAQNAGNLGQCESAPVGGGAPFIRVNVGLWNAALAIGTATGDNPGPVDGNAVGAGFAPIRDAYDNLGENGERWGKCRAQVKGWQDLARRNGWVSGQ